MNTTTGGLEGRGHVLDATALIPAAGRVPEGVLALANVACPAMIPVAGRPVIQWTMGYLVSLGITQYHIAVAERGLFVEEFVDCVFGDTCEVEFLVPGPGGGPGSTIATLARGVTTRSALVVLGDTSFQFKDPQVLLSDDPTVLVEEVDESYRWCIADIDRDGIVRELHDKEPGRAGPLHALIGVYHFPDVVLLDRASTEATAESNGQVEISDILRRVSAAGPLRAERAGSWLDCGNPDRQAASQRVLLEQRAFNELEIDAAFGTITKRSRNVAKFVDEIDYLRLLPTDLSVLFPRVLSWSTDWDNPHVTMEFYGYPTLSELFVFESVDPGIWRRVLEHLHRIVVDGFMARQRPLPDGSIHEMLLGKVDQRTGTLEGPIELLELVCHTGEVTINDRAVPSLTACRSEVERRVAALAENAVGTVIHGDLCFSNVLYDLRSGICKLIDPRGSFGQAGIYGDVRYDVAKLYHSVHGLYDFITADLFRVRRDEDGYVLDIRTRPDHGAMRGAFEQAFFTDFDRGEILLITALVFLGLPALHYDRPQRQMAFYLRGLELLDEALAEPAN